MEGQKIIEELFVMKLKFVFFISVLFLLASNLFAQKTSDEFGEVGFGVSKDPLNCETAFTKLQKVKNMIEEESNNNGVLILIARLGNKEKNRKLNRLRLLNVKEGLQITLGIEKKIVIAEGENVDGFGRVEFYLAGKFIGALLAVKNRHKIKCDF